MDLREKEERYQELCEKYDDIDIFSDIMVYDESELEEQTRLYFELRPYHPEWIQIEE